MSLKNESGTPQAAAAELSGEGTGSHPAPRVLNMNDVKTGEAIRNGGLFWQMPAEYGGGYVRLRPAAVSEVSDSRDVRERQIRDNPEVKRKFRANEELKGKAATELNRHVVLMTIMETRLDVDVLTFGTGASMREHRPNEMDEQELREFFSKEFFPPLNLSDTDTPPENELNLTLLNHLLEGLGRVSTIPAREIAEVGKDYKIGHSENVDYS